MEVTVNGHEVDIKKGDRIDAGTDYNEYESCSWVKVYRRIGKQNREIKVIDEADF